MIGSRNYSGKSTGLRPGWVIGFFLVSCVFHLQTFSLTDDHFDRISRAHQIAQYGELPYRDFFDPGYFLTLFSSAAAQSFFGSVLLGEAVIAILGLSLGFSLTLLLLVQVTRSWPLAVLITGTVVFAAPRFYDYDKVLFYSLGIFLCWRYIERTSLKNLALLGLGTAAAFWFRYDNGLYIASATTVTLFVIHGKSRVLLHRIGLYGLVIVALSSPCLIFLQLSGGIWQYGREIIDYANREGTRTDLFQFPKIEIDDEAPVLAVASRTSYPIRVRWVHSVDDVQRRVLEQHYALRSPVLDGGRTWAYQLQDTSSQHIRQLIEDPLIEDTGLIDRGAATVPAAESLAAHVRRSLTWLLPILRVRVLPGFFSATNAIALSYYLCLFIPLLTFFVILVQSRSPGDRSSSRSELARGLSLATLCLLVDAFVLRAPIAARIGAVAPAVTLLGTWNIVQWGSIQTKLSVGSRNSTTPNIPLKIAYTVLSVWPDRGSSSSGKRKTDALASYPQVVGGYHGETCSVSACREFAAERRPGRVDPIPTGLYRSSRSNLGHLVCATVICLCWAWVRWWNGGVLWWALVGSAISETNHCTAGGPIGAGCVNGTGIRE